MNFERGVPGGRGPTKTMNPILAVDFGRRASEWQSLTSYNYWRIRWKQSQQMSKRHRDWLK